MVSLLSNPLATADQLAISPSQANGIPADLEVSLRWAGGTLLQSAGVLLRLPQPTIATAVILQQRFYLTASVRAFPLLPSTHASLFLAAKLTEVPTSPKNIINVTSYLLSTPSPCPLSPPTPRGGEEGWYVDEYTYQTQRTRLLEMETAILRALGFHTHTALPYALAVNYAQTLECLDKPMLKSVFAYVNDGLLSPSLLFLTHQPNAIAAAALYLAARDRGVKLPEQWWEVFDVDREDLGFLVAGLRGVGAFVEVQRGAWGGGGIPWEGTEMEEVLSQRKW